MPFADSHVLFKNIMSAIQCHPPDKERYVKAQKDCDELEQQVKDMVAEIDDIVPETMDFSKIRRDAEALRATERGGDILMALNYLSDFTGPGDPRGRPLNEVNSIAHRARYLAGVEYFVIVAREYLEGRIESADYFATHPEELRP